MSCFMRKEKGVLAQEHSQKMSFGLAVITGFPEIVSCNSSMDSRTELPAAFAACVTVKSQDEYLARHGEYSLFDLFRKAFPQVPAPCVN